MSGQPTKKQKRVAEYIAEQQRKTGTTPTYQEIADALGYSSTNTVRGHIELLEKKGALSRTRGKARSVCIKLSLEDQPEGIPLLGDIPAGVPFEAIQDHADQLPIDPTLFPGDQLFALRVSGLSMRDAGILDQDVAILNHQADVADGEIAAVLIEEDTTLKRVVRSRSAIRLCAANPDFPDITIRQSDQQSVRILGRLVGVLRTSVATK